MAMAIFTSRPPRRPTPSSFCPCVLPRGICHGPPKQRRIDEWWQPYTLYALLAKVAGSNWGRERFQHRASDALDTGLIIVQGPRVMTVLIQEGRCTWPSDLTFVADRKGEHEQRLRQVTRNVYICIHHTFHARCTTAMPPPTLRPARRIRSGSCSLAPPWTSSRT